MKQLLFSILTLSLTFSLLACSPAPRYASDRSVTDLCEAALESLDEDGDDYLLDTVGLTEDYFSMPDYVTEHVILYSRETETIDEFGIFRVETGRAVEFSNLLHESYLVPAYEKNRDFYDSYIPEETPKLRDARVECYGDTVVYAILSATDQSTLFAALRNALQGN